MSTTYIDNKRVVANNNNSHNHSNNNNTHTTNNKRNPLATSTPKKPIFQDAVVAKSDVGEFQGGYFIMSSNDDQKIKKPVSQSKYSPQRKRLPTVNQLNNVEENSSMDMKALKQQQQQQYLQIKNRHQQYHQQFQQQQQQQQQQFQQENNSNNTESILITPSSIKETNLNNEYNSPKKLNTSNNRIVSPQSKHQYGTSPPRSNSPTKNGKVVTSPSTNWAAGKWSNSPAANTLPVLDFDDFFSGTEEIAPTPQQQQHQQQQLPPQFYHHQQPIFYHQPPQFYHQYQQEQPLQQQQQQPIEQPNLESMSNQLKMLLNINSTVAASTN